MPSTAKAPYAAYIQARSCGQREGFVYLSTHTEVGPRHGVPMPPVAEAELVGGAVPGWLRSCSPGGQPSCRV